MPGRAEWKARDKRSIRQWKLNMWVHFFLHTAVKQGGPSELSCAAAASRADASSERLTSSHSSPLKPKTPHFLRFCVPRHAWRGGGVTWTENTVIQGVGNLLPTAWVVQLWEAALSAECRGTQGGYCLIQSIILVFFHLSVLHFFLPKMMLKNPLLCPTWKHTLVVECHCCCWALTKHLF